MAARVQLALARAALLYIAAACCLGDARAQQYVSPAGVPHYTVNELLCVRRRARARALRTVAARRAAPRSGCCCCALCDASCRFFDRCALGSARC
jgi:hypothetical protein